jgi:hypothetical protein
MRAAAPNKIAMKPTAVAPLVRAARPAASSLHGKTANAAAIGISR